MECSIELKSKFKGNEWEYIFIKGLFKRKEHDHVISTYNSYDIKGDAEIQLYTCGNKSKVDSLD